MPTAKGDPEKLLAAMRGRPGVPKPLEKDVQKQCLDWLRLWGAFPVRVNSGRLPWTDKAGRRRSMAMNSEPGCSDTLVCLPDGTFAAIEFKREGGKATAHQLAFLAEVTKRGGLGIVVDSLPALVAALKAEGYDVG